MKKTVCVALALILTLSLASLCASAITAGTTEVNVWDGTTADSFSSGSGLENDPYIIKTGAELDYLAASCKGGETYAGSYFKLAADIDWAGKLWTPIGYDTKNLFSGHFDGNGQTIYNLECFDVYAGIFGCIKEGSVKNLKVDHATFTTDTRYAGAIAGWMKASTVEGVSAGANVVVATSDFISNTAQVGGLFGIVHSSTVNACVFEGEVKVTAVTGTSFLGGIAGVVGGEGAVTNCINRGSVSNPNEPSVAGAICYVGGVVGGVGASSAIGTVENCINYGKVASVNIAGGVVGRIHVAESVVKNSYSLGEVTGAKAGAVVGYIGKAYVMAGNAGVSSADAVKAVGEFASGDGYSEPGDSHLKVASESDISTKDGFLAGFSEVQNKLPTFNKVTPVAPVETTAPEETTAAPETDDQTTAAETTSAPETVDQTTVGAESTTSTPTTTQQPDQTEPAGGCGSTVGAAAAVICILALGFVLKKDR